MFTKFGDKSKLSIIKKYAGKLFGKNICKDICKKCNKPLDECICKKGEK